MPELLSPLEEEVPEVPELPLLPDPLVPVGLLLPSGVVAVPLLPAAAVVVPFESDEVPVLVLESPSSAVCC